MLGTKRFSERDLHSAALNALKIQFCGGHYSTIATYCRRWKAFVDFARDQGLHNISQITATLMIAYATHLVGRVNARSLSLSTAINRLSCCNVVLRCIFGHERFYLNPSDYFPNRNYVRKKIPGGLDYTGLKQAATLLVANGHNEYAIIFQAWRLFGMRFKEAVLQDYRRLLREAREFQLINIIEGTKNGRGRYIDRWIPIDAAMLSCLEFAARIQGLRRNLISESGKYIRMEWRVRYHYRWIRRLFGLPHPHDLRAAYACHRYDAITGFPAPIIAGKRLAPKQIDREARKRIAYELGHSRVSVCVSYIGASK